MSKYNNQVIIFMKKIQNEEIKKLINNYNEWQLNSGIKRIRCINRIRKKTILNDIISFERYITQELFELINDMYNYNIFNNFKILLKRIEHNHHPDSQFILMNIYEDYYCEFCQIKCIFISKSTEFDLCIENDLLSKDEILCWEQSCLRLENLIEEYLIKFQEYDHYLTNKFYNMCLINKITLKYFSINDDTKTSFKNNFFVNQLEKEEIEVGNIIDLIKEFINPYTQTFEGWICGKLSFTDN